MQNRSVPDQLKSITDFVFYENRPQKADIILVPGGMRPQLVEKAIELFHSGLAPYILPSGGIGPKSSVSEWEFLANIALEKGVPANAILREDKAGNTFENAAFSRRVVEETQIKVEKAILVCKAFHSRRALLTYQVAFSADVDFIVCPIIDDRNIRRDNWFLDEAKIALVMGEVAKIGQYFGGHIPALAKR